MTTYEEVNVAGNTENLNADVNEAGLNGHIQQLVVSDELREKIAYLQFSDDGNAQAVFLVAGNTIKYTNELGWFIWNRVFWENNEHTVKKLVSDVLKVRHGLARGEGSLKKLKSDRENISGAMWILQSLVLTEMSWFDRYDDKVPAPNGVIDLRTGRLLPHAADYGFTYVATVPYNIHADTSLFKNLIQQNIETGEKWEVEAFQRWLGYMLTGDTREEKLMYLWGPGGSGKGTTISTAMSVLPKPIQQTRSFSTFTTGRKDDTQHFDMAKLERARMLHAHESDRRVELNAAMVKSMTGDELHAAYKGKDGFDFIPRFKVVLTSNFPLNADVDDNAIWNRPIVVHFPHERRETEDENNTLKAQFQETRIKEGVLLFMVQGAVSWYQQGLNIPEAWITAKQAQREDLDMVSKWLGDNTEDKPYDVHTSSSEVISNYTDWCKLNSVEPKKARAFAYTMERKGYKNDRDMHKRYYHSINLTRKYMHDHGQIIEVVEGREQEQSILTSLPPPVWGDWHTEDIDDGL